MTENIPALVKFRKQCEIRCGLRFNYKTRIISNTNKTRLKRRKEKARREKKKRRRNKGETRRFISK